MWSARAATSPRLRPPVPLSLLLAFASVVLRLMRVGVRWAGKRSQQSHALLLAPIAAGYLAYAFNVRCCFSLVLLEEEECQRTELSNWSRLGT